MKMEEYCKARGIIEDLLIKDLFGPLNNEEVIDDTLPSDYYIIGRLFPQGMLMQQEDIESSGLSDETDDEERTVSLCYQMYPSSVAISFTVKAGVKQLNTVASFAWYEKNEPEEKGVKSKKNREWHRKYDSRTILFDTDEVIQKKTINEGLELRLYTQKEYLDGAKTFTLAMVNINKNVGNIIDNNKNTYFQIAMSVTSSVNGEAVFIEKMPRINLNTDEELLNLEMLYRHNKVFGTGHGCSVGWESEGDEAISVYSEFIPRYDMRQMKPALHNNKEYLSFKYLSEKSQEEVCEGLSGIIKSYEEWINGIEQRICEPLPNRFQNMASNNVKKCREALERITEGIKLLGSDPYMFKAFQLVNKAMLMQRNQAAPDKDPEDHFWYPFQLAFILQEIKSIDDPQSSYRDVIDLLWFPTGGGKTEAYLGLAAFTIFLRRMKAVAEERQGAGVTVMMRYTLRLLTLQQFERATSLICACELIRSENSSIFGYEEIGIGLWVGGGLTPNKVDAAEKALSKIKSAGYDNLYEDEANPCQILSCPWCKNEIKPAQYEIKYSSMRISCSDDNCEFHDCLPVYLVDEDIYKKKPSLVIGTVDKFARMTWEPKVGLLFGLHTDYLPPELIIQDELHLISGPLGTIVGLYEVAIDEFCSSGGIKPKIIASTATIRNAENQILSLYARDFRQFPPQGIDIRDSYFAIEASPDEKPARKYTGLMAPGTSGNTFLIRVYAIMLFATRYLQEAGFDEDVIDTYWTLTGYFNSLKQLGGAVVNVIDDVQARLKYLYGKKFNDWLRFDIKMPDYQEFDELTSRKANSDIAKILKRMEVKYPAKDVYDLILASNMLSVGIDVGRLGIMMIQGQPKTNSEYIQATSRVGRQSPGLILTMYDTSRSRDRSHYEQFKAYHSSLYKYVEATSLTPFAERARDRALHAVLISLCRHRIKGLQNNNDAENIKGYIDEVSKYIDSILDRVKIIDSAEHEDCKEELALVLENWTRKANGGLYYQNYWDSSGDALLTDRFDEGEDAYSTLNSMRNVDFECEVRLEG